MPLTAAGTPALRWGEVRLLVMGLMKQTDSHLYADLTNARFALSLTDMHLIYLAVGWVNSQRRKGAEAIQPPELYNKPTEEEPLEVTDTDMEIARSLLTGFAVD